MDSDICATLLQIICFPYTQAISFSPTCQGICTKFYCNLSQGYLGLQQKSAFSPATVVLQYKKEKRNCLTAQIRSKQRPHVATSQHLLHGPA